MANSSTRYIWRYVDFDDEGKNPFVDFQLSPYTFDLDGFDREDVAVVAFWDHYPFVWDHFKDLVGV